MASSCEVPSRHEDRPLRELLDDEEELLEDGQLEHGNLVEEDDVVERQPRRRVAPHPLGVARPSEAETRVHGLHEDVLGVRKPIQVGVHQGAGGSKKENATASVDHALGGVHKQLRLARARGPLRKQRRSHNLA